MNEEIECLYEDDEIWLLVKKAGMAVQGGTNVKNPLDEVMRKKTGRDIFLVHRLDKDTSGLIVVAKSREAAGKWSRLISSKRAKKEYTALCAGNFREKEGITEGRIMEKGVMKNAKSGYKVLSERDLELKNKEVVHISLVRLTLYSGRMHQLRIHMAKCSHPILADDLHGDFKLNKKLRKIGIKTLTLCASKITLPLKGVEKTFKCTPPFYSLIYV